MKPNNWFVITGPPSSGKSTIIKRLAKLGYATTEEFGRLLIEAELAEGKTLEQVNVDSAEFEKAWVELQVKAENKLDQSEIRFFDRGVIDTLAYFKHYGWQVPKQIKDWCKAAKYRKVFLFEMLDFEDDGVRVESAETAKKMQDLFGEVYKDAGYDVVFVPKDTVENRLNLVLQQINVFEKNI